MAEGLGYEALQRGFEKKIKGLAPDLQHELRREFLRTLYRSSLYLVCTDLLGYKDVNLDTHGDMLDALESESKRKLIVMPRGTLKSSIGVIAYSIWLLIRNPNVRIMIDSETYVNAKNLLREIKAHLNSPKVVALFGDPSSRNWNEGECTVAWRTKVIKEASLVVSSTSTVRVGQHFDVILSDDLNSQANSNSSELRANVIRHYQMNIAILEPEGTYVIIGTRYAVDDVIGWVITNELGVSQDGIRTGTHAIPAQAS